MAKVELEIARQDKVYALALIGKCWWGTVPKYRIRTEFNNETNRDSKRQGPTDYDMEKKESG